MKTCWKCGDPSKQIDLCIKTAEWECDPCHRECGEERDRDEDLDPDDFVIEEGGPMPLEREL